MRMFLIEPGELGVRCMDGDEATVLELGFSSVHGLERLLGALPLRPGDSVAVCRARDGDDAWQGELEALVLRNHPGVVAITHELAPLADPPVERPASSMDVHCLIDYTDLECFSEGLRCTLCEPVVARGSGACSGAVPLPAGMVRSLWLFEARPDGGHWLVDSATGCAHPGQKELARTALCLLPVNRLVSAQYPITALLDLSADGELTVLLHAPGGLFIGKPEQRTVIVR